MSLRSISAALTTPDTDGDRVLADRAGEPFAAIGVEPLGVVETHEHAAGREDDGRRNDGAGERAAPGFIDSGDEKIPAAAQLALDSIEIPEPAELREESGQEVPLHLRALCQTFAGRGQRSPSSSENARRKPER